MQEPHAADTPDAASVDEYVERIQRRYEEASARVLGPTRHEPDVHIDDRQVEELEVNAVEGLAVRHRSHRTDMAVPVIEPAVVDDDGTLFELDPEPAADDDDAAPHAEQDEPALLDDLEVASNLATDAPARPWPRPVNTDVRIPVRRPIRRAQPEPADPKRFIVPFLGVVFLGLVAIWLAAWFESGAGDPVSVQERIDQALAVPEFAGIATRVEDRTLVLVGVVADEELVAAATRVFGRIPGFESIDNRLVVSLGAAVVRSDADILADAQSTLDANGFTRVEATVEDQVVTLRGTVRTTEQESQAVAAVERLNGVARVVSDLEVVPLRPQSELAAEARAIVAASGYSHLSIEVEADVATLSGVVDRAGIEGGVFESVEPLKLRLLAIDGVGVVRLRLQLKGDEGRLREALVTLIDASPIVFPSASSELSPESLAALDEAARIILGQPGLRVLIAGHTDATGEAAPNASLAQGRGDAVRSYLVAAGVPANRLFVVAYGELFPGEQGGDADRRVEFEVGP
ncbi:MAG TPA: OmpA family protein [Acidimicrobiia bacterium]